MTLTKRLSPSSTAPARVTTRTRLGRAMRVARYAAFAAALVLVPAAGASFPGTNGSIAYASDKTGNFEIYRLAGSTETNLTNNTAKDTQPVWSASGSKIAFVSDRDSNQHIFVMNFDGSGVTNLTNTGITAGRNNTSPTWSPDGTKLAFVSDANGNRHVFSMNANGSGLTDLTPPIGGAHFIDPAWGGPRGDKIVYASNQSGSFELYIMDANGANKTRLTETAKQNYEPNWSPDGTNLAFVSDRDGNQHVFVASFDVNDDDDGDDNNDSLDELEDIVNRTNQGSTAGRNNTSPAWSPDGTKLLFVSDANSNQHVFRINTDGTGLTDLTPDTTGKKFIDPDWQAVSATATAPSNSALPSISGTVKDGSALGATPGTWSGTTPITYAYRWQRCNASGGACSDIAGAAAESYTLTAADVDLTVRVVVTASNSVGSATASSAASGIVAGNPISNSGAPTISGIAVDGGRLTAAKGTWDGTAPISYAYQWQRCNASGAICATVSGATGTTYTLGLADVGSTLKVVVTASNSAGTGSATSAATAVVAGNAPSNTVGPGISGNPVVGGTLTGSNGNWAGTAPLRFSYQWQRCGASCADIGGATSHMYGVSTGDVGSTLQLVVTATNAAGSASAASGRSGVVSGSPGAGSPFVASSIDDGAVVASAETVTITAAEAVASVVNPTIDGNPLPAPTISGRTVTFAPGTLPPGLHQLRGVLKFVSGGQVAFALNFTIGSGISARAKNMDTRRGGSMSSMLNLVTIQVPPGVVPDRDDDWLVLEVRPETAVPSATTPANPTGGGSSSFVQPTGQIHGAVIDVTATWAVAGQPVREFGNPLDIVLRNELGASVTPATLSDGDAAWRQIPLLATTVLPSGQRDGYYVEGKLVHILTRHLSRFTLLERKLQVRLSRPARVPLYVSSAIPLRLRSTVAGRALFTLADSRLRPIKHWRRDRVRSGRDLVWLGRLPGAPLPRTRFYLLTVAFETPGKQRVVKRVTVRLVRTFQSTAAASQAKQQRSGKTAGAPAH